MGREMISIGGQSRGRNRERGGSELFGKGDDGLEMARLGDAVGEKEVLSKGVLRRAYLTFDLFWGILY